MEKKTLVRQQAELIQEMEDVLIYLAHKVDSLERLHERIQDVQTRFQEEHSQDNQKLIERLEAYYKRDKPEQLLFEFIVDAENSK